MHIGFLTPEYPDVKKPEGGLGNYIRKVALDLIQRGNHVTVFVLDAQRGIQNDAGIELRNVNRIRFHWRLQQNPTLSAWLGLVEQWMNSHRMRQAVLREHYLFPLDIVQTPNYKTPGIALMHNRFFPLVCRCSSYSPLWRAANGIRRQLPDAISDWVEARQVIEAEAAFAPSEFISLTYEHFEAVKPVVIRTPVELPDLEQDDSVYQKLVTGKRYLLYFGTLNGIKGVDVLIQAAEGILSKNKDLSLILVGRNDLLPGGVKALDSIQSTLSSYWQEKRVIYSSPLPRAQLYPFIQHALGVILPSRVDNYPNTCLEALSLGVPVVGTYDSSLDEMIEDGKTGFLAENGNSLSLQEAMNRLLTQSPEQSEHMTRAIHRKMEEVLNEDRIGILLRFYKETIAVFLRH